MAECECGGMFHFDKYHEDAGEIKTGKLRIISKWICDGCGKRKIIVYEEKI